jgi:hypothetical protein
MFYSAQELTHFERIRKQFEQQDVSSKAKEAKPTNGPPTLTTWSSLPMRRQDPSKTQSTHSSLAGNPGNSIAARNKGKGRAIANPDSGPDDSEDSDDYHGTESRVNGTVKGNKGKGEDKTPVVDGFVGTEEEDLYS